MQLFFYLFVVSSSLNMMMMLLFDIYFIVNLISFGHPRFSETALWIFHNSSDGLQTKIVVLAKKILLLFLV